MAVRYAQEKDVAAMLRIYTPYVEETNVSFEYKAPSADTFAGRLAAFRQEGMPWLVYEENGTVLGYAYAHRYGERQAYNWTAVASIYLADAAHRRGIGSALYAALFGLLTAQGYCSIYAMITSENKESVAFHKAQGFESLAQFDHLGYKQGRWLGVTYMRKTLAPYTQAANGCPCKVTQLEEKQVQKIWEKAEKLCKQKELKST